MATKVDLHVHSCYSDAPSVWCLQRLGVAESYTQPERIYELAKQRGMSFVTLTDHDRIEGSLVLKEAHPLDVFAGVEVTATFPEDDCNVHILVYNLTQAEFEQVSRARADIYVLRDYLREQRLPHAVAHATYSVNGKLTIEHLEKLILLFDVFEGINGGRNRSNNETWMQTLQNLTPARIETLSRKYGIKAQGDEPWTKGVIAGSDDHAGLFVGETYTSAEADSPESFLKELKRRRTLPEGRQNDYRSLAFVVAKVAYDLGQSRRNGQSRSLLDHVAGAVFEPRPLSLKDRFILRRLRSSAKRKDKRVWDMTFDLVEHLHTERSASFERRMDVVCEQMGDIVDEYVRGTTRSMNEDLRAGNVVGLLKSVSSLLPAAYLALPFIASFEHLHHNRPLLAEVSANFLPSENERERRTLWFTDTLTDLNGVSVTLRKIASLAHSKNLKLQVVTSLSDQDRKCDLPPNVINLPHVDRFALPYYEQLTVKIPAVLKSLQIVDDWDADQVYISTPGPVGLLGLLAARLLNAKCVGVYQTDFTLQVQEIVGERSLSDLCDRYLRWFYSHMDEVLVPSAEYVRLLEARGFDSARMRVFPRGIDSALFAPVHQGRTPLRAQLYPRDGFNLLFVGRVSRDKGLDFMADVYARLAARHPNVNWCIVGNGPYLPEFSRKLNPFERVTFAGALGQALLPEAYSAADVLVFPSATDTFGMAVLEAQSCGLPAIVTDHGGPQEIVVNGETGFVARAGNPTDWVQTIENLMAMRRNSPEAYRVLREAARQNALRRYDWESALGAILGDGVAMGPEQYWLEFPSRVPERLAS